MSNDMPSVICVPCPLAVQDTSVWQAIHRYMCHKNNKHHCAAANAGIMALFCVQKPISLGSCLCSGKQKDCYPYITACLVVRAVFESTCEANELRSCCISLFPLLVSIHDIWRLPDILLVRNISMLHTVVADASWHM